MFQCYWQVRDTFQDYRQSRSKLTGLIHVPELLAGPKPTFQVYWQGEDKGFRVIADPSPWLLAGLRQIFHGYWQDWN